MQELSQLGASGGGQSPSGSGLVPAPTQLRHVVTGPAHVVHRGRGHAGSAAPAADFRGVPQGDRPKLHQGSVVPSSSGAPQVPERALDGQEQHRVC